MIFLVKDFYNYFTLLPNNLVLVSLLRFFFFQTWADIKQKVKEKYTRLNNSRKMTGGGEAPFDDALDDFDNEVLDIANWTMVEGHSKIRLNRAIPGIVNCGAGPSRRARSQPQIDVGPS